MQIGDSHDDEGIAAGDRLMLSSAGDPNICGQLSIPTFLFTVWNGLRRDAK